MIEVDYPSIRYYLTKSGAQLNEVSYDSKKEEMEIFFSLHYIREMIDKLGMEVLYINIQNSDMKIGLRLYKK